MHHLLYIDCHRMVSMIFGLLILLSPLSAIQAESVNVCYFYGCKKTISFELDDFSAAVLSKKMMSGENPEQERENVGWAVQQMYELAAQAYPPLREDRGGNFNDGSSNGRMDCADHSENVATFLKVVEKRGWLRFHRTNGRQWRAPYFVDLHYTAVLRENETKQDWAIDTWFKDFGQLPVIIPLSEWKKGYSP